MKILNTVLIIIGFILSGPFVGAQERINLQDLVVKDSTGAVCPPEVWRKLMVSGQYSIRILPDKKTAELYRLTPEQVEQMRQKRGSMKPRESAFFETGAKIAPFVARDMQGERFNLKEMQGKVVVLNFWFINCAPCRQEIPDLNKLVETYKDDKNVVFLGIAPDEKFELKNFLKQTPFNYHIIADARYISGMYGINSYPTHVVINQEGKVVFHTTGLSIFTVDAVKAAIEAALKSGSPQ